MEADFNYIVAILVGFLSILFSLYLFSIPGRRRTANLFFAGFLLCTGLDYLHFLLIPVYLKYPGTATLIGHTNFLVPPLFYLYIRALARKDFRFSRLDYLHLLPFLASVVLFSVYYYSLPGEQKLDMVTGVENVHWLIRSTYIFLYLQLFFYLVLSLMVIRRFRQYVNEQYSESDKVNHKWLVALLVIYLLINIISLLKNISLFNEGKYYDLYLIILTLASLGFIVWVIYMALRVRQVFEGIESGLPLLREMVPHPGQKLVDADHERNLEELLSVDFRSIIEKLEMYMNENEPFLKSDLTLHELATEIDISARELSIIINHKLNRHFFDFINDYRIRKATELLSDPSNKKVTVLEIMYDVGFNSKSSFNTAFKKHTGYTPTEFRRTRLKKAG